MKLNKIVYKYWLPVLLALVVAIVVLKYRTFAFHNAVNNNCVNTVNQLFYQGKCYSCPAGSSGINWVSPGYVECSTSDNKVVSANVRNEARNNEGFQTTCPARKSWKCPPGTKEFNNKCYFPCEGMYEPSEDFSQCVPKNGKGPNKGISSTMKGCYA
jgi:hypothetical protein